MESLIKEEEKNSSICMVGGDSKDPTSASILDKYDRFLEGDDSDSDNSDNDNDYFPNESILKEHYDQVKRNTSERAPTIKNRLSLCLPGRFSSSTFEPANTSLPNLRGELPRNGTTDEQTDTLTDTLRPDLDSRELRDERSGVKKLKKLIEQLNELRDCGPEGNGIFCTEEELTAIQVRYGQILDFFYDKSNTFEEKAFSNSDSTTTTQDTDNHQEQNPTTNQVKIDSSLDRKLLEPHLEATKQARDKFFAVEQQVSDLIDQLELVERYKMESLQ